jgi:hypothetical protein
MQQFAVGFNCQYLSSMATMGPLPLQAYTLPQPRRTDKESTARAKDLKLLMRIVRTKLAAKFGEILSWMASFPFPWKGTLAQGAPGRQRTLESGAQMSYYMLSMVDSVDVFLAWYVFSFHDPLIVICRRRAPLMYSY